MSVNAHLIRQAVRSLGLSGRPVCVHSSLRSFGHVEGGAPTVVEGLVLEGCTVLVPTFSDDYAVPPPPDQRPERNGWDYANFPGPTAGLGRVYTPASTLVDKEMGTIPASVLARPDHVRGNHPLNSFSATGPLAMDLVAGQAPLDVYAPLRRLAALGGWVVLMGVGLESLTLLHLAEQQAGRSPFIRWANGPDGTPTSVQAGGCSDGFPRLDPYLAPLARETRAGPSQWRAFPVRETLAAASRVIARHPSITHCGRPDCERCNDAVAGGPTG